MPGGLTGQWCEEYHCTCVANDPPANDGNGGSNTTPTPTHGAPDSPNPSGYYHPGDYHPGHYGSPKVKLRDLADAFEEHNARFAAITGKDLGDDNAEAAKDENLNERSEWYVPSLPKQEKYILANPFQGPLHSRG
jgi:hypothetical protein